MILYEFLSNGGNKKGLRDCQFVIYMNGSQQPEAVFLKIVTRSSEELEINLVTGFTSGEKKMSTA